MIIISLYCKINNLKLIRSIFFISILILNVSCPGQDMRHSEPIVVGAEQLDTYLPKLSGKNIGMVVNQTSMIGEQHLVDVLVDQNENDFQIARIFSPEHGFRGQAEAGQTVKDATDIKTEISIVSLYGKMKKPTPELLSDLDIIVFDIQDVGARFYTYISTMHYIMEACAENGKKVLILDRPNPNGHYVDGPVLEPEFKSFVGMHPIPIVHGMTVGELASMINEEGWLEGGVKCELEIIPVKNYTHTTSYSLPVNPSPNLPNDLSIALYPSLCLFEGTLISVGRGTYYPFTMIGFPDPVFGSYTFTPVSIQGMSTNPKHKDLACYGIDFSETQPPKGLSIKYLIEFYNKSDFKDNFFRNYINLLAGTDKLVNQIKQGKSEEDIKATWQDGLTKFKSIRKKYLLYPDFE